VLTDQAGGGVKDGLARGGAPRAARVLSTCFCQFRRLFFASFGWEVFPVSAWGFVLLCFSGSTLPAPGQGRGSASWRPWDASPIVLVPIDAELLVRIEWACSQAAALTER
jgi:hypothetical protein